MNWFQKLWAKLFGERPTQTNREVIQRIENAERDKESIPVVGEVAQTVSTAGIELIKHFEGCYLNAYMDPVGVPTLAYGRIRYPDGSKIKMGDKCTQEQAEAWLKEDVEEEGCKYVRAYVGNGLRQCEFDALSSFCYNRGAGRLRELVRNNVKNLPRGMLDYNWAGSSKKVLEGLDRRRHAEREMYLGRDWKPIFGSITQYRKWKKENAPRGEDEG